MRKCKALGLSVLLAAMVAAPVVPAAWADQAAPVAQDAAAGLIEVNGAEYPSLVEALGAIPADKPATIKLLGDVTIPDGMKLTITTDVTVVLNGHALTSNDGGDRPIYVKSTGSIIIDGTAPGSAVVLANPASYGVLEAEVGADVTIKGGTYTGDTDNGCLFRVISGDNASSKVLLEGVTVSDTNAAVFNNRDTLPPSAKLDVRIIGGSFESSTTSKIFYLGSVDRETLLCEGVSAKSTAGSPVVELSGAHGVFRDCDFAVSGKPVYDWSDTAVFVGYRGKATIESGSYTSKGYGAYIGTSGGELELIGGTVQGDKGAIQADADGETYKGAESIVTVSGGTIQGDLGGVTHGKATSAFTVTGGDISGDIVFKQNGTGGDTSASVSGGTFDRPLKEEHCAEGFAPAKNDDGSYGVKPAEDTAVLVTANGATAGFTSLEEAFAYIPEGSSAVVELLKDEDISDATAEIAVAEGTKVRLDLAGHVLRAANNAALVSYGTLTICDSTDTDANGTGKGVILATKPYGKGYTSGIAVAKNGGTLVLESGLVDCASEFAPDNANKGQFGLTVINGSADASVVINGGKVVAGWYCVAGNGTQGKHEGRIIVNGGELVSTADYAIYSPQAGGVDIKGGSITGAAGAVHIQRGSLNITGGTLVSLGTGETGSWGDGTGGSGNAVVNYAGNYGKVDSEITGGTFVAKGDAETLHVGTKFPAAVLVSGGTFNKPVSADVLAPGFGMGEPDADGNYVVHRHEMGVDLIGDETGHWHACTVCGEKDAVVPHEAADELAGVANATCGSAGYTGDKVCKDCGHVMEKGKVVPATGAHACDAWTANHTDHWHVCTACGKPYDIAAHEFGDWTVTKRPSATEAGAREHVCTICGQVVSEAIPALGAGRPGSNDGLAQTGDLSMVAAIGASLAGVAAIGIGGASKRRR